MSKRFLATILAIVFVLTLAPSASFAATIADTYGLTTTNTRVQITDDSVAVFSHPTRTDGTLPVSSDTLVASLSTPDGHTISWVDSNKEDGTSASVKDGFVKLSLEGQDDAYIPITVRGNQLDDCFKDSTNYPDSGWSYSKSEATFNHQAGGIGGKKADEYAYSITAPETEMAAFERLERAVPSVHHTFEFNVYVDGNASAKICYQYSSTTMLVFGSDGKIQYRNNEGIIEGPEYTKGQWHRVAISYDQPRGRYLLYVDGKMLTDTGTTYCPTPTRLFFGIAEGSSSGKVCYADLDAYYGYYYGAADYDFAPVGTTSIIFNNDDNVVKYDEYTHKTPEELTGAISAIDGISSVAAFTDSTLTVEATEITDSTVLALKNDASCYHYYTVEPFGEDYVPSIADLGVTSSNARVMVCEDKIAVFSNSLSRHAAHYISSEMLSNALSSPLGYTFTHVDENKEPANDETVTDGYVYATLEGGRSAYYPIVRRVDFAPISKYNSASGGGTYTASVTAGGGKDASDTCEAWSATSALTASARSEVTLFPNQTVTTAYTMVFNIRADGDAVPAIYYRYSDFGDTQFQLFKWNANGDFYYHRGDSHNASAFEHVLGGNLDRSQWQQVAITFDYARGRYHIYVNGVLMTETTIYTGNKTTYMIRYGITEPTSNGTAYFDDVETYYGYYYAEDYGFNVSAADKVALRPGKGIAHYDASAITTPEALVDAIKSSTDASMVKAFADATLTTEASAIDENTVVVVASQNGKAFTYYKPQADDGESECGLDVYGLNIYATIDKGLANGDSNAKIIFLTYAADGNLAGIKITPAIDNGEVAVYAQAYVPSASYKAFYWAENLAPLCPEKTITPAAE